MATIYDAVSPRELGARWEETALDREPYLLERFFPNVKHLGTDLSVLQGTSMAKRPLDASAYDVPAIPLSRGTFDKLNVEIPYFKNSLPINEKLRQELLKVLATGNERYINTVLERIYNDNEALLDDAAITREMMRAQLLTTGAINYSSNGQVVEADYGVPEDNKVKPTVAWTDATTSDPIKDIKAWQLQVENATGVRPNVLIMNSVTLANFEASENVKKSIFVLTSGVGFLDDATAGAYIRRMTGCSVFVDDKGYTNPSTKVWAKFIPDNVVVLVPDKALGETAFGTTPAEADLMSGATAAEVAIVDTGVALTAEKLTDPVYTRLIVSQTTVPTLEVPKEIIIADVSENNV